LSGRYPCIVSEVPLFTCSQIAGRQERLAALERAPAISHMIGDYGNRRAEQKPRQRGVGIWALRAPKEANYEASNVDSLKPRKYIHLGLVDWKFCVNKSIQKR
jgi:hypothetical protein